MKDKRRVFNDLIARLPSIGILSFVFLFIYSSTLYPGGSSVNLNSEGFDWINNYLCNLMNEVGLNGKPNPARPFAIFSLIILCLSTLIFFVQFANTYSQSKIWKQIIKVCGVISMSSAILIFTKHHDLMTIISSLFGVLVVIGIIKEIYNSNMLIFKISGTICIILLGINNYIYYSENQLVLLPLIQKITFVFVLAWIISLNLKMIKKE